MATATVAVIAPSKVAKQRNLFKEKVTLFINISFCCKNEFIGYVFPLLSRL